MIGDYTAVLFGTQLTLQGQTSITGGGIYSLGNGASVTNLGSITAGDSFQSNSFVGGAGTSFTNLGSITSSGQNSSFDIATGTVSNQGSILVQAVTLDFEGVNTAAITVESGSMLTSSNYTQSDGKTVLDGGTLAGGPFLINRGTLTGSGTINANVINAGQVIPGGTGAAGLLTINGNYTQTATGSLDIELGGTTSGSQYDQLAVSGKASLGGTLNVATMGSLTPALGNMFQVSTFVSSSGTFMAYHGPNLAGGLFLDPVLNATNLTLDTDQVAISGAPVFPLPGIPITLSGTVNGPSSGKTFAFSWTVTQNGNPFQSGSGSTFRSHPASARPTS